MTNAEKFEEVFGIKEEKESVEIFKVGDRISHFNYGEGTIVSIEWDYPGFYKVDFDTVGRCIVNISNISKIKETKEMTSYKVGDIVDHPLYNESIIIDISRFESGYIEIVPLTGSRRGLRILVSIDKIKPADNNFIISIENYNEMANTIEKLKEENKKLNKELLLANSIARRCGYIRDKNLMDEIEKLREENYALKDEIASNKIRKALYHLGYKLPEVKSVLYHKPATIIFWKDGTKTVVKAQNKEKYDNEKGFVMAYLKKILGNEGNYYEKIKRWTDIQ